MISLAGLDSVMSAKRQIDNVESAIYLIHGQRVMLDSDFAAIYQVTTKRLNEQLRRNHDRFPNDFAFQLTAEEFRYLKSQFATSSSRSQFVTSDSHGGKRKLLWAGTEHCALMLTSVLNSNIAV